MALAASPPTTTEVGHLSNTGIANWTTLYAAALRVVQVTTSAGLTTALANAIAGDYIEIMNSVGTVNWSGFTTSVNGTAGAKIVIGPQASTVTAAGRSAKSVTFTGTAQWMQVNNAHYIIGGFNFVNHSHSVLIADNATSVRFTDCTIDTCGSANNWYVQFDRASTGWQMDHCLITAIQEDGRVEIRDPALYTNPTGGTFSYNTLTGNTLGNTCLQIGQGSAKYSNANDPTDNGGAWTAACTVEYCHIKTTGTYPEQPSIKSSGNIIRYNYWDSGQAHVMVRQANSCQVYGNYVASARGTGAPAIELYGTSNIITNNIIEIRHPTDCAIKTMQGGFRTTTPVPPFVNGIVANNTLYDPNGLCDRGLLCTNQDAGALTSGFLPTSGNVYENNILYKNTGTYPAAPKTLIGTTPSQGTNNTFRNNQYYGTAADGGAKALDTNSVTGNPNLDMVTYTPGNGTVGLGTAYAEAEVTVDYFGNTRPTAYDIGAVENGIVGSPGQCVLLVDTFAGTSGTDLSAHTIDIDAKNSAWTISAANAVEVDGSNKVKFTARGDYGLKDVNSSDVVVKFTYNLGTSDGGLLALFRCNSGKTQYYALKIDNPLTNNPIKLVKCVGGADTILASSVVHFTTSMDYVIEIFASGTTLYVLVDNLQVLTATDSSITTGSYIGFQRL